MGRAARQYKTRRYTRDVDQIFDDDFAANQIKKLKDQEIDETKPGLGQFYCIPCAKYFESEVAIKSHVATKRHKRRLKQINDRPYTPQEADAAAGLDVLRYQKKKEDQEARRNEPEVRELLDSNKVEKMEQ
uniref:ARAD1B07634p n=1 Tax=Blastobotrys adeninivorans TaxID=409370 RepID=A0A060T551_BLAAD